MTNTNTGWTPRGLAAHHGQCAAALIRMHKLGQDSHVHPGRVTLFDIYEQARYAARYALLALDPAHVGSGKWHATATPKPKRCTHRFTLKRDAPNYEATGWECQACGYSEIFRTRRWALETGDQGASDSEQSA